MWFEDQDCVSLSGQVKWNLSLCRSALSLGLLTSADYSKTQVLSCFSQQKRHLLLAHWSSSFLHHQVTFGATLLSSARLSSMPLSISLELQMAFIRRFLPPTVLLRQLQWSSADAEPEQGIYTTFSEAAKSFILFQRYKG